MIIDAIKVIESIEGTQNTSVSVSESPKPLGAQGCGGKCGASNGLKSCGSSCKICASKTFGGTMTCR